MLRIAKLAAAVTVSGLMGAARRWRDWEGLSQRSSDSLPMHDQKEKDAKHLHHPPQSRVPVTAAATASGCTLASTGLCDRRRLDG